jgi:hypothetical protein
MITRANEQEFTLRLEKTIDQISSEQVPAYLDLLQRLEDIFTAAVTGERTMQSFTTLTTLYLSYTLRLPKNQVAETLGLILLRSKLEVALEFFSDIYEQGHWSSDHALTEILTRDNYDNFCAIIIMRGLVDIGETPWYEAFGRFSPLFLRTWTRVKGNEPVKESLRKIFNINPAAITTFLQNIAPLSNASHFEYENTNINWSTYEALKDDLDIHYLYKIAASLIKDEQLMPYKGDDYTHVPEPIERLHQLVYLHRQDEAEAETQNV